MGRPLQVSGPIRLGASIIVSLLLLAALLEDLGRSSLVEQQTSGRQIQAATRWQLLGQVAAVSSQSQSSSQLPVQQIISNSGPLADVKQSPGVLAKLGSSQVAPSGKQADMLASFPQASSREIEKQIVDKILGEGYDKRIRPAGSGPYNASRPGK